MWTFAIWPRRASTIRIRFGARPVLGKSALVVVDFCEESRFETAPSADADWIVIVSFA